MSARKSIKKTSVIIESSDVESDAESDIVSEIDEIDEIDENDIEENVKDIEDDDEDEIEEDEQIINVKKNNQYLRKENSNITLVDPEKRITSEYMTIYEYSMVIGTRATHISEGAPIYIDISGITNARDIAIKEVDMKKCPLSISRKIHNRQVEIWHVNEMTKPLL
jgi:DNA-directed RNA polymerase I, II, and III subunit RPABC2